MMMTSPEAKELVECGFAFAQASSRLSYKKFEATIVPALAYLLNSFFPIVSNCMLLVPS
jgi:hypothetical protein